MTRFVDKKVFIGLMVIFFTLFPFLFLEKTAICEENVPEYILLPPDPALGGKIIGMEIGEINGEVYLIIAREGPGKDSFREIEGKLVPVRVIPVFEFVKISQKKDYGNW